MWGCVCEELNVKDAYFHVRNNCFFEFMASMAVLSVTVRCTSAYISRADGRVGQSFGNDGGSLVQFGQNQLRFGRVSQPDPTSNANTNVSAIGQYWLILSAN